MFPSYISGVHHSSSSSTFPAVSLGFTILLLLRSPAMSPRFTILLLRSPAISQRFTILLLLLLRSLLYLWGSPFFSFFYVPSCISRSHHSSSSAFPSYISGVHHSSPSSSTFPAISLGFTILLRLRSPNISLGFTVLLFLLRSNLYLLGSPFFFFFYVNSKGKIPSTSKKKKKKKKSSPQRRIEPTTLHQARQRAQHATNELFRPRTEVLTGFAEGARRWKDDLDSKDVYDPTTVRSVDACSCLCVLF